jgi:hypothetical protein
MPLPLVLVVLLAILLLLELPARKVLRGCGSDLDLLGMFMLLLHPILQKIFALGTALCALASNRRALDELPRVGRSVMLVHLVLFVLLSEVMLWPPPVL